MLSGVKHELVHALRALVSRPAFSVLVVGVLASGLTCVIFMLAMLDGFVLRPLPFAAPVLIAAATLAVIVPARRALRVDPIEALRQQ